MSSTSSSYRVLRIITLFSFIPALVLLLAHGVVFHRALPAIGILPMFTSASFSLVFLVRKIQEQWIIFCMDVFLAMSLISILIPYWILTAGSYAGNNSVLLSANATVPMMLNFCIHIFCALSTATSAFPLKRSCPHCLKDLRTGASGGLETAQFDYNTHRSSSDSSDKMAYQPLAARYEDNVDDDDDDVRESSEIGDIFRPSMETLESSTDTVKQ